jgi:glycosyltransferase involved in cell wall biosynthesis
VGRVSPEKGVHVLLEAFEKVLVEYPNAQLLVIGPPAQLPKEFLVGLNHEAHVAELTSYYQGKKYFDVLLDNLSADLKRQVTFTNSVPHAKLPTLYRDSDVLINPSFSEAFGMSLIEAMASEVPVVATSVGGMPDIVGDGETGLLVAPGDSAALATAIIRLLSDQELREKMGKAGRQRAVDLFSWEQVVKSLLNFYQEL